MEISKKLNELKQWEMVLEALTHRRSLIEEKIRKLKTEAKAECLALLEELKDEKKEI